MGCFNGQIKVYTPDDLSNDFKTAVGDVLNEPKGGGYWTWKPYIIADMLSKLNDGDMLVYADAGCTLQPAGVPRLKEYTNMISEDSRNSVLVMRLRDQQSKKWTTNAVLEYFKQPLDGEVMKSNQILAGIIVCRKCKESEKVIGRWLEVAMTRPDLFTDKYSEESKRLNPDFNENRHDQPILSIIVKTSPYKNTCLIIEEEVEKTSIPVRNEDYFKDKPIVASRISK